MSDQAYIVGGCTHDSSSNACRMYDLSDNAWTSKTNMTYSRKGWGEYGAGCYIDAVVAGNDSNENLKTEKYNISGDSWTTRGDMPKRGQGKSRAYANNCVFFNYIKYDLVSDIWKGGGWGNARTFRIGSKFYDCSHSVGSYAYDSDIEVVTSHLPHPTTTHGAVGSAEEAATGYGFIWGGRTCQDTGCWSQSLNQRFDQANNVWASRTNMPAGQMWQGAFTIDGCPHSVGGLEESYPYPTRTYNHRYDNAANSWTTKTAHPTGGHVSGFAQPDNFAPRSPTNLSVSAT